MTASPALAAYLAFSARAEGWGRRKLERRLAAGKEDPARMGERRGEPGAPRPQGPLVWFHAASVGEALSLLEVIRRLGEAAPGASFLVTTGTRSSAEVLSARLPERCLHQYVPIDVRAFVRRFLDHWRPDLAVWTESELWPSLITETHSRRIPMLLVNARLSERSAARWRWSGGAARDLLSRFAAVQAQDDQTAIALKRMGLSPSRLQVTGTLKEGIPPPPCDEAEQHRLTALIAGRPVWLAASTHPGEEDMVSRAHRIAQASSHRLLLILVPRHPERGPEIGRRLDEAGWRLARRSAGETPETDTQIYLADTLGEMGLWYRLSPVSFVAGSLVDRGGHNPFEPAALGSAILHGPHVRNFADVYRRLDAAHAAREVRDAETLGAAVAELIQPDRAAPMAYAAWEICSSGAEVTDEALALILQHLPEAAVDGTDTETNSETEPGRDGRAASP